MKSSLILFPALLLLPVVLLSCGTRREVVALESSSASSADARSLRSDTLLLRDSVLLVARGDTVRIREVRYRDRILRTADTLRITDTLRTEVPVEVVREAPRYATPWRSALAAIGICALLYALYRLLRLANKH